jgi:pilus assembly protein CpaE
MMFSHKETDSVQVMGIGERLNMSSVPTNSPQSLSMKTLSVVLLGANEDRRRKLAGNLAGAQAQVRRQGTLPDVDDLRSYIERDCDVLIIDLDRAPEAGLELVEAACSMVGALTVMVYSPQPDRDLVIRAMRAGAREFLQDPISVESVAEAMVRATSRRDEVKGKKKTAGKLFLFVGAKGGSGTTTLAANFALMLKKESGQEVALIDLNLQLGDAALSLGLVNEFSTADALRNEGRLDSDLVTTMFVEHSSGLRVLGAADRLHAIQLVSSCVMKLAAILRNDFDYVVVDAGSDYSGHVQSLIESADKVYLVTQVSVVELRNCHRLIASHFPEEKRAKLEVVLNRYTFRAGEIDQPSITKALTVAPAWKVPSHFESTRQAQNTATAIVARDGPITRALSDMAKAACGHTQEVKKKIFGLF